LSKETNNSCKTRGRWRNPKINVDTIPGLGKIKRHNLGPAELGIKMKTYTPFFVDHDVKGDMMEGFVVAGV
jgi:hypothetical protein